MCGAFGGGLSRCLVQSIPIPYRAVASSWSPTKSVRRTLITTRRCPPGLLARRRECDPAQCMTGEACMTPAQCGRHACCAMPSWALGVVGCPSVALWGVGMPGAHPSQDDMNLGYFLTFKCFGASKVHAFFALVAYPMCSHVLPCAPICSHACCLQWPPHCGTCTCEGECVLAHVPLYLRLQRIFVEDTSPHKHRCLVQDTSPHKMHSGESLHFKYQYTHDKGCVSVTVGRLSKQAVRHAVL